MSESVPRDWRMSYAAVIQADEAGQLGPITEDAEVAIQERLRVVVDSVPVLEESELDAALRILHRLGSQLLTAA